jgi:hypothetical protein
MRRAKQTDRTTGDAKALERIVDTVDKLAKEVESLCSVIHGVEEDVASALDNAKPPRSKAQGESAFPMHITSMPRDPLAPDFGKRLNRFRPEDLPSDAASDKKLSAFQQQDLFSSETPETCQVCGLPEGDTRDGLDPLGPMETCDLCSKRVCPNCLHEADCCFEDPGDHEGDPTWAPKGWHREPSNLPNADQWKRD